jgi:outer membrane protein assembly factor BamB
VNSIRRQFGLANPVALETMATPMQSVAYSPLPSAPARPAGYPRPFGDTGMTSRCPTALPAGDWRPKWTATLDRDVAASFVITDRDRIVVQGGGAWQLLDSAGKRLGGARSGGAPVFLDPDHDRLFFVDRNEQLTALRQRDGAFDYKTPLSFGDLFAKPLVASAGDTLVLVSVEQEGLPHRPAAPNRSALQVIGTGARLARFTDGTLSSLDRDEKLLIGSVGLLAVLQNGHLIAAWPDRLLLTGLDLQVRALLSEHFAPGLMSADETGRAYIVLANAQGERALWVISETGQRMLSLPLPPELGTLFFPPIVGFDHRIHVLTRSRLVAFAASGERLWVKSAQSEFAGACVTADGAVLAADGREVAAFGRDGTRRVLAQVPGAILAPPILSSNALLLVAEGDHLHAFQVP